MKERKSIRLQEYDYSSDNLYFVTSCVHNRVCCFGEIAVGTGRDPSIQKIDPPTQKFKTSPSHDDNISVGTGRDLSLQNGESLTSSYHRHMILNGYGLIAEKQWHWLGDQYPYLVLHEFVVMPNHIHGIIEINRGNLLRTGHDLSVQSSTTKIKPLSELMGAYKTTVSKQIHLTGFTEFQWQRSFYEHIIRDEKSLETISDYIFFNPENWEKDNLYNK
jgi:putative transposase